jgi:hypothetical protein
VQALFTDEALTALNALLPSEPETADGDDEATLPDANYENAVKTAQANSPKAALADAQTAANAAITAAAQAANKLVKGTVSNATLQTARAAVNAATTEDEVKTAKEEQLKAIYNAVITAVVKDLTDNGVELADATDMEDDAEGTIEAALTGEDSGKYDDENLTVTAKNVEAGAEADSWTADIKVEYGDATVKGTAQTATGVNVTVAAADDTTD